MTENYICKNCQYNTQILDKLKKELPADEITSEISDVFKVFADNTRIRILWVLFDEERCVYDIAETLNMTQSAISHQLRIPKRARLVKSRRDGKNTYYSLDDDHVKRIIEQAIIHINE